MIIEKVPQLQEIKNKNYNKNYNAVLENISNPTQAALNIAKENTVGKLNEALDVFSNSGPMQSFKNATSKFLDSNLANDILEIGNFINNLPAGNRTDLSCKLLDERMSLNDEEIYQNSKLISKLLEDREKNSGEARSINVLIDAITKTLQQSLNSMNATLNGTLEEILSMFGEITEGYDPAVLLFAAIEEFLSMLDPFLELPGMPNIPFIGDIKEFIKTMAKIGKISFDLGNKKNSNIANKAEVLKSNCDNYLVKLGVEILNLICYFFTTVCPFIFQYVVISFILEFLDMIKPVIDYFGLVYGPYAKAIMTLPKILSLNFGFVLAGSNPFISILKKSIEPLLYAVVGTVNPSNASIDDKLKYLLRDREEKLYENDLINLQIQDIRYAESIENAEDKLERLSSAYHNKTDTINGFLENIANFPTVLAGPNVALIQTGINIGQDLLNNSIKSNLLSSNFEEENKHDGITKDDIDSLSMYIKNQKDLSAINLSSYTKLSASYDITNTDSILEDGNYKLKTGSDIDKKISEYVDSFMGELKKSDKETKKTSDEESNEKIEYKPGTIPIIS
jgi:hypothetical protein